MANGSAWKLRCPWCDWWLLVNPRGARGGDRGAGVEAAEIASRHALSAHGKTWHEFLEAEHVPG